MSPKLPQVSGDDLISFLEKIGYVFLRQKGSHVRLKKLTISGEHKITVPRHKQLLKGTLNDILSEVSLLNGLNKEDLINKLNKS